MFIIIVVVLFLAIAMLLTYAFDEYDRRRIMNQRLIKYTDIRKRK